eukprot:6158817-Pleurochrysis_carterae.AAC.1
MERHLKTDLSEQAAYHNGCSNIARRIMSETARAKWKQHVRPILWYKLANCKSSNINEQHPAHKRDADGPRGMSDKLKRETCKCKEGALRETRPQPEDVVLTGATATEMTKQRINKKKREKGDDKGGKTARHAREISVW